MDIKKCKPVYWLSHLGRTVVASPDTKHLFRVICQHMKRRMCDVTVKEAIDAGWEIRRA